MLKLVKVPGGLESFAEGFRDLFTRPSHRSFSHMLAAVAASDKSKTVNGLHQMLVDDYGDKKGRSSYDWFFNHAKWDEEEIAQRKAEMFFETSELKKNNRVLLIIDDTYNEKKGKHTDGVGKFFDHSKGYVWGNNFVTSVLQCKGIFIPHKAKMYLKEEDAAEEDTPFKTKPQIAFEDIIKPLEIPETNNLMVVFDSWWFSADLINKISKLGHHTTCQLKSNKIITPKNISPTPVREHAEKIHQKDYKELTVKVRGKKKKYKIIEAIVELEGVGKVKLIISKKKQKDNPKYYICTNTKLSAKEIISIYEDRWNIETGHRESNQKLGFKDYQMRSKKAIERFIQVVFSVWTALLLIEMETPNENPEKKTIGEMTDQIKTSGIIDLMLDVLKYLNLPPLKKGLYTKVKKMGYKT